MHAWLRNDLMCNVLTKWIGDGGRMFAGNISGKNPLHWLNELHRNPCIKIFAKLILVIRFELQESNYTYMYMLCHLL